MSSVQTVGGGHSKMCRMTFKVRGAKCEVRCMPPRRRCPPPAARQTDRRAVWPHTKTPRFISVLSGLLYSLNRLILIIEKILNFIDIVFLSFKTSRYILNKNNLLYLTYKNPHCLKIDKFTNFPKKFYRSLCVSL